MLHHVDITTSMKFTCGIKCWDACITRFMGLEHIPFSCSNGPMGLSRWRSGKELPSNAEDTDLILGWKTS